MNTKDQSLAGARRSAANRDRLNLLLLASAGALLGGCVVREYRVAPAPVVVAPAPVVSAEVVATEAPPAPVVEQVTVAPAVGLVWVPGGWVWEGRWRWEGGHWTHPPFRGAVWVPHRYVYRNGAHFWVRGGWR